MAGNAPRALNEGRDRSPGDTRNRSLDGATRAGERSTKAGTVVPATLRNRYALNEGRDRSPGDTSQDTAPFNVPRSTKAGTVVPATLLIPESRGSER